MEIEAYGDGASWILPWYSLLLSWPVQAGKHSLCPSVLSQVSKWKSLEEKAEVTERWFKVGCCNVPYNSSRKVCLEISQGVIREENRDISFLQQLTRVLSQLSRGQHVHFWYIGWNAYQGAFTIWNGCKSESQSRPSFFIVISFFPPLPISLIHFEMSWEKFDVLWYTLGNLRISCGM